jgi:hypothetical protein
MKHTIKPNVAFWPNPFGFARHIPTTTAIPAGTDNILDAAGEYFHCYGEMYWADGGSHTVSAAGGGSIIWRTGATVTWSDGPAEFRVGIQDLSTTMNPLRGDGTWDVYRAMTTATDTLTGSTWFQSVMNNGTKTIAHGDYIVIALEAITASGGYRLPPT